MTQSKEKRIEVFLSRMGDFRGTPARLRGDASTRSFYRIHIRGKTAILMVRDPRQPDDERSFLDVRDHLAACGAAVPEIYLYDEATGAILMEDFGDETLEERLKGNGAKDLDRLYRCAIEELLKVQVIGSCLPRDCAALHRSFDEKKLMEELRFFLAHTVEGLYGSKIRAAEREKITECFRTLSSTIASFPSCLNHRDYHSRNLMVVGRSLGIVDFQDARMGPCQYDLASLLRDSYTVLKRDFLEEMIDYYLGRSAEEGISWCDRKEFMRRFDLVSLQRNIKACGTFGYMTTVRRNGGYLRYLEPTFAYVRENARKFDYMDECVKILARHVPPLR